MNDPDTSIGVKVALLLTLAGTIALLAISFLTQSGILQS